MLLNKRPVANLNKYLSGNDHTLLKRHKQASLNQLAT